MLKYDQIRMANVFPAFAQHLHYDDSSVRKTYYHSFQQALEEADMARVQKARFGIKEVKLIHDYIGQLEYRNKSYVETMKKRPELFRDIFFGR